MKRCLYCSQPIYDEALCCPFCGRNLDFELQKRIDQKRIERERLRRQAKAALITFLFLAVAAGITFWGAVFSPVGSRARIAATQTASAVKTCDPEKVFSAANQLIDLNDRWADIMALAVSVDREAAVFQIDRMQKLRRDARAVDVPDCMKQAKSSLIDGMDDHINGMLDHVKNTPRDQVNETLTRGNFEMNTFADEVERLQKCAPGCW